jgi:sugar lactone lactonase YvrE
MAALSGDDDPRDARLLMSMLTAIEPVMAVLERPHSLLEGPRIDPTGDLVFSDVIAGGVFSCSPDGTVSELLARRRGVGGIVPHADGGWVLSGRTVIHLGADGSQRELLSDPEAPGYNDLGSTPAGELLVGELRYRPMAGDEPRYGRLLLIARDAPPRVLTDQVLWPNGIGVAPDGRTVYISDYAHANVLAVPLSAEGAESAAVFAEVPSGSADGLAVDVEGGVWVALGEAGAVARFTPAGALDELVELPAGFVSSLSFGGPDLRDVLITTADNLLKPELGGTLLRARSQIPGLPVSPVRV